MSLVDDYEAIRRAVEDLKREENPLKEVPDGVGLQAGATQTTPYAMGTKGSLSGGSLEAAVNEAMERLKESMYASTPTATPTPTSYVRYTAWFMDQRHTLRLLPGVQKTTNRT